jgi:ATP synthase protein I
VRAVSLGRAGFFGFFLSGGAGVMSDRDGEPTPSSANKSTEERALSDRLWDLDRRLDQRRASREAEAQSVAAPPRQGYGMAMRLGGDFVAGIVVGAAVGWGIDRLFGTSPWGLMVFLLLGFAAGILSVLRSAGLVKPGPPGPDDLPGTRG